MQTNNYKPPRFTLRGIVREARGALASGGKWLGPEYTLPEILASSLQPQECLEQDALEDSWRGQGRDLLDTLFGIVYQFGFEAGVLREREQQALLDEIEEASK